MYTNLHSWFCSKGYAFAFSSIHPFLYTQTNKQNPSLIDQTGPWGTSLSCQSSSRLFLQVQSCKYSRRISWHSPGKSDRIYSTSSAKEEIGENVWGFVPPTYFLRTTQKDPVATEELFKGVTHGIASFPDADGFHHARVAELTHAEISVKELRDNAHSEHTFKGKVVCFFFSNWIWLFSLPRVSCSHSVWCSG